jgi:hypothetical protein
MLASFSNARYVIRWCECEGKRKTFDKFMFSLLRRMRAVLNSTSFNKGLIMVSFSLSMVKLFVSTSFSTQERANVRTNSNSNWQ